MDKRAPNYLALVIMLSVAAGTTYWARTRPATALVKADLKSIPAIIGDWEQVGPDGKQDRDVLDGWLVTADNFLTRDYASPDGAALELMVVYKGCDRRSWHLSEMCFSGTGFNVNRNYTDVSFGGRKARAVELAATNKNTGRTMIALYFFVQGEHVEASFARQQAAMALARLRPSKYGWAFVRVTAEVVSSEQETLSELRRFIAGASGPMIEALTHSRTRRQ